MDLDDAPSRPNDALTELLRQDLDPLSIAELDSRIAALEREIVRSRTARDRSVSHRANADALFRR